MQSKLAHLFGRTLYTYTHVSAYFQSKPNCLLPSIVNLLLLPHAIYKPETQLHPFIASAIRKTLHQFIFGISKLNPKQDDFIARILRDIVAQYLPRLVAKTGSGVNIQGAFTTHPLLKCFTVCEKPEIWRFVLESLSDRFFTRRGSVPHEHAVLVSDMILCVLSRIFYISSLHCLKCIEPSVCKTSCNMYLFCRHWDF